MAKQEKTLFFPFTLSVFNHEPKKGLNQGKSPRRILTIFMDESSKGTGFVELYIKTSGNFLKAIGMFLAKGLNGLRPAFPYFKRSQNARR